jgi:hypothetical protein
MIMYDLFLNIWSFFFFFFGYDFFCCARAECSYGEMDEREERKKIVLDAKEEGKKSMLKEKKKYLWLCYILY